MLYSCPVFGCGRLSSQRRCPEHRRASGQRRQRPAGRPERGTALWRQMRREVWERDGGVCQRCGCEIADGERWDLGHIVPYAAGGAFERDNLRVECMTCNRGAREG